MRRTTVPSGKRLDYRAVLNTDAGAITIALQPELAPNHVRSFVALARAGYYDGLVFERNWVGEAVPASEFGEWSGGERLVCVVAGACVDDRDPVGRLQAEVQPQV